MTQFNPISFNNFIVLLVFALLIYIVNRLIIFVIKNWITKEGQQNLLSVYVPVTMSFIWIFFILYSIYILVLINPMISIFLSSIVLISTWSYVYDYVHGTLFKVQKGNLVGQLFKMGEFSGRVVKMKSTRIHLQLENSEVVEYPYSKVSEAVFSICDDRKDYINTTINMSVTNDNNIEAIIQKLRIHLFNIPWIASNEAINIKIANRDSNKIDFKINVNTLDEKFIPKIQQSIELIESESKTS